MTNLEQVLLAVVIVVFVAIVVITAEKLIQKRRIKGWELDKRFAKLSEQIEILERPNREPASLSDYRGLAYGLRRAEGDDYLISYTILDRDRILGALVEDVLELKKEVLDMKERLEGLEKPDRLAARVSETMHGR